MKAAVLVSEYFFCWGSNAILSRGTTGSKYNRGVGGKSNIYVISFCIYLGGGGLGLGVLLLVLVGGFGGLHAAFLVRRCVTGDNLPQRGMRR